MDIAKMIPDRVRSERLMIQSDPIANAIPFRGNEHMQTLFVVWFTFIEPSRKNEANLDCPTCLKNVLSNFRAMKEDLIRLEKDYQLLKSLRIGLE